MVQEAALGEHLHKQSSKPESAIGVNVNLASTSKS